MPTPGISLVGFLDQKDAVEHLQNTCIPPDNTQDALIAAWNAAKARLGAPFANAGNPNIRQIPAAYQNHVNQVLIHPPFQAEWKRSGSGFGRNRPYTRVPNYSGQREVGAAHEPSILPANRTAVV